MNAPNLPLYYRDARKARPILGDGHRGLWYERFFDQYDGQWQVYKEDEKKGFKEGKREWLKTVEGKAGDPTALQAASDRLVTLCRALGGEFAVFAAPWHFATGLGNPHPVENGFLWHPTLGAPYLPGAAVKGLVRAWVEAWMDFADDKDERAATLHRWFGSKDKEPQRDTAAGGFIFFDALPIEPVKLKADIMTPHMAAWYEQGADDPLNPEVTPADWHNPVPVPFLVADQPKFMFAIAPRGGDAELPEVMAALSCALEWLGAGAKTAAGYGRLVSEEERIETEVKNLTLKQLAEKFGKERNKTKAALGDKWGIYLEKIIGIHGDDIREWRNSPAKSNEYKAYKTVFERGEGN
ncbi:MAG: type III-B CRISPR module RAMP protein Cmr6 [Sulfuricellaceae bacterium]